MSHAKTSSNPNDFICCTCCSRADWRPASVVSGNAVKTAAATVVTASMPNQRGARATSAKVSFGDVITPISRAKRFFDAEDDPEVVTVSVMACSLVGSGIAP